ncbi:hypothetical protein LCGC14_2358110 [marine sediment metagenome]|uniref:Uncharacterized protein n=1 Tax=marine sediment metagenome TaxID=412755 RepID=A0A0F9CUN7_9ZZZZ
MIKRGDRFTKGNRLYEARKVEPTQDGSPGHYWLWLFHVTKKGVYRWLYSPKIIIETDEAPLGFKVA